MGLLRGSRNTASRPNLTSHISIRDEKRNRLASLHREEERERERAKPVCDVGLKKGKRTISPRWRRLQSVLQLGCTDEGGSVTVAKSSLAHSAATPATQSVVKTAEM